MKSVVTAIAAVIGVVALYLRFKVIFTIIFIFSLIGLFISSKLRKER